jgi:hypothetical protein
MLHARIVFVSVVLVVLFIFSFFHYVIPFMEKRMSLFLTLQISLRFLLLIVQ